MDAGVERMLLYKRIQRVPLRSTLNIALYDMRKLEYDIRRTVVATDRLMSANVLKDNYVERLMETRKSEVFAEFVPRKHRRSSQGGVQRTTTVTPVRRSQEGLSPGLRRSADIISLQLKCRKVKIAVRQEKRSISGNFRRVLHAFHSCSSDIGRVRCATPAPPPSELPTEQFAKTIGELRRKVTEIRRMRRTLTPG